ncbi:hypothetical protein GLYMA_17G142240v4 [Glycine max]|nr:hypothetical protein GLYMA_17G142240v4 [Glycine max]
MNWGSMIICAMLFTISDSDYSEDADKFNIVLWFYVRVYWFHILIFSYQDRKLCSFD